MKVALNDKSGLVCPYCGVMNYFFDSGELWFNEDTHEWEAEGECDSCAKPFCVSVAIHLKWSTRKIS